MPQLFLDCDGVLANFDEYAEAVFGLPPRKAEATLGTPRFWADLRSHEDFYFKLPLMPDAMELFEAVKHLDPIILTGTPLGDWAEPQKRRWGKKHFDGIRMICCMSADKRLHMQQGDTLVDDYLKYRNLWEEAGGVFVHHKSAKQSIRHLIALGVLEDEEYLAVIQELAIMKAERPMWSMQRGDNWGKPMQPMNNAACINDLVMQVNGLEGAAKMQMERFRTMLMDQHHLTAREVADKASALFIERWGRDRVIGPLEEDLIREIKELGRGRI